MNGHYVNFLPGSPSLDLRRPFRLSFPVRLFLVGFIAVIAGACQPDNLGGQCASDDDCSGGEVCIVDAKAADGPDERELRTYCTTSCSSDADCPLSRTCRAGRVVSLASEERYCVDRVRSCGPNDPKNGLDDDCDGVTDPASGAFITRCLDDEPCGAFVCTAPSGQPETICAPPISPAPVADYAPCVQDEDCRNGMCEAGFCSPSCRPGVTDCRVLSVQGQTRATFCARSVGEVRRPPHNLCQLDCSEASCPSGTQCVWRDILGTQEGPHVFVCSELDPTLLPLGADCPSNRVEDDLRCQHGLCFDLVCTRRCGGPGASCQDVGDNFECLRTSLFYAGIEFENFICVESRS